MEEEPARAETPEEAKAIETALAPTSGAGGKAPIKVGEHGIAFETAAELYRMAQAFVQGGVAPKGSTPGGVMAAMLKGRALGLDEVTAVGSIIIINGRTMMAGSLILGLLKRAGIEYRFHWTGEGNQRCAHIQAWDASRGEKQGAWPEHTFSMGDAVRAGLADKKGAIYKAWPDEMILWRAVSKMGRQQYPEICAGIYVPGEIPGDPQISPEPAAPMDLGPPPADPLLAELEDVGPVEVAPFASHAEADRAIAAVEGKGRA